MRAYIAVKFHVDSRNRDQIEQISRFLDKGGMESVCIARDFEKWGRVRFDPHKLMQLAFHQIDLCDCLIVDLTEKGVGIGIEAGYASAKNIPIITIAHKGSDISDSLQGITSQLFFYENYEDLLPFFEKLASTL